MCIARTFIFRKRTVVRQQESPEGETAVYVCNHSGAIGPMSVSLYFDRPYRSWVTHCVFDKEITPNFIFHDFFQGRQFKWKAPMRLLSRIVAVLLRPLLTAQNGVKVYRTDARVFGTYKESVKTLEGGENLVIFAESPVKGGKYVNKLYDGIADLGLFYWRVTGKKLKYYPVYIPSTLRTVNVGESVEFCPDNTIEEERVRLTSAIESAINAIGDSLPPHKVANFLPPAYYENYAEYINDPAAYWKFVEQKHSD